MSSKRHSLKKQNRPEVAESLYVKTVVSEKVVLPITLIGKNLDDTLEKSLKIANEELCGKYGHIKHGSVKFITKSSGLVENGSDVVFDVVFECMCCLPPIGMHISCTVQSITKAGITCVSATEKQSPVYVFISSDHNTNTDTDKLHEGSTIIVEIIGSMFELKDRRIACIGSLVA